MKELIVNYRKMFELLKLDLPNCSYGRFQVGLCTLGTQNKINNISE